MPTIATKAIPAIAALVVNANLDFNQIKAYIRCYTELYYVQELRSGCTQDRIERREIPCWRNVWRRFQRIRWNEVVVLQEVTTHFRREEHHCTEDRQEYKYRRYRGKCSKDGKVRHRLDDHLGPSFL